MICPNCKMAVREGTIFCENCGIDLRNIVMQNGTKFPGNYAQNQNPSSFPAAQGMGYGQNPPAMAEKKLISKWILILAAEALLFLLIIYGLKSTIEKNNSPEQVAESYFVHMANGEWEEAYQELDLEEVDSDFISTKMFAKAQEQTRLGIINNYQLNPDSSKGELYELNQALGGNGGGTDVESALGKNIRIDYRVKGDTENSSYIVPLNHVTDKTWKVGVSNLVCKDFCINVPKGASVSVDDIALENKYLLTESNTDYGIYCDSYSIPCLFLGLHDIKITMEDMADVVDTFEAGYDSLYYTLESMQVKPEILDVLLQKARDNMQQIYSAAMAGKNFNTIKNLFTEDKATLEQIQESYEELLSNFHEKNSQPTKISFRHLEGNINDSQATVDISFEYQVEYTYEDWWDGSLKNDISEDNESLKFSFVKENGNWVQTNLGCSVLDY